MPRLVPLELVVETHLPFQPRACALPPNLRRMGHVSQLCSSEVGNGDIRLLSVSLSHRGIPVMQSKASRTLPRAAWRAGRFPGGTATMWSGRAGFLADLYQETISHHGQKIYSGLSPPLFCSRKDHGQFSELFLW